MRYGGRVIALCRRDIGQTVMTIGGLRELRTKDTTPLRQ